MKKIREFELAAQSMVDSGMAGFDVPDWEKHAVEYKFENYTISAREQDGGTRLWAVVHGAHVYSKSEKDFVYEPLPSSRSQDFIDDTRFNTKMEAWLAYNQVGVDKV